MSVIFTVLGFLLLPIGWVLSFWVMLSFWSPTAYNICKTLADSVYAASRKLRQMGRNTSLSEKAKR